MCGDVNDIACPACGAQIGEPCYVPLTGTDTTGWSHDARILAPIYADLRSRVPSTSEGESS